MPRSGWRRPASTVPSVGVAALLAAIAVVARASPTPALTVRATEAVAPCLRAALAVYPGAKSVAVEVGHLDSADVLVGSAVEVTRALEAGAAAEGSDVAVARIPWVLSLAPGNPASIRGVADLARPEVEVWILGGAAAHEARRRVDGLAAGRVHELRRDRDGSGAPVVVVPLSLASGGERIPLDVPPLEVQAAVGARAASSAAARELTSFLSSESGTAAFARCGGR